MGIIEKIIRIKNNIFQYNTIMLLGKTFSFTQDEANIEDLVKACDLITIFMLSYTEAHYTFLDSTFKMQVLP